MQGGHLFRSMRLGVGFRAFRKAPQAGSVAENRLDFARQRFRGFAFEKRDAIRDAFGELEVQGMVRGEYRRASGEGRRDRSGSRRDPKWSDDESCALVE